MAFNKDKLAERSVIPVRLGICGSCLLVNGVDAGGRNWRGIDRATGSTPDRSRSRGRMLRLNDWELACGSLGSSFSRFGIKDFAVVGRVYPFGSQFGL